jgi:ABC-2 type transport system permease protein
MMATYKAELKKIITIRSTYILAGGFLLLCAFVAFYVHGYKDAASVAAGGAQNKLFIATSIIQIANTLSVAGAIIGLLLMAHEYRHNTIVYTLAASNSRTRVLLSKVAAILVFVFFYSLLAGIISLAMVYAGVALSGHSIAPQDINFVTFFAKVVFDCEAFALAGLLFAILIRNQVGAIAALFVLPNTIEGLLSLLLKHNSVYLPFTALAQVTQPPSLTTPGVNEAANGYLSPAKGALVFLAYIVAGYLIAWYLFLKRDAN